MRMAMSLRWSLLMSVTAGLLLAPHLWPASAWLEVASVRVGAGVAGEPIPMVVDRTVHREFHGTWFVTIRQWTEVGWVPYCNASGTSNYAPGSALPAKLTLAWWTDNDCPHLEAGRYVVDTRWIIRDDWPLLPERTVVAKSNIFEVAPRP